MGKHDLLRNGMKHINCKQLNTDRPLSAYNEENKEWSQTTDRADKLLNME